MMMIVGCTASEIAPSATQDEAISEDIGITSFFFSVNPTTMVQGQCAVVRWAVEPEGDWPVVFNNEVVGHVDQREVCPERTQAYELYADPPGPDIHEEIITLEVVQPGSGDDDYDGEGEIIGFQANPDQIRLGECTQLTWEALAPPGQYFILNGEPVPPSGTRQVCPSADTIYELLLVEPSEAVYAHINVAVDQRGGVPAASTPSSATPGEGATATPELHLTMEPLVTATQTPWLQIVTPGCVGAGCEELLSPPTETSLPTSTATSIPTVPAYVATLLFPTPTQTPFGYGSTWDPEIYLEIVDIFLVNHPVGDVDVRVKNTCPERVETDPYDPVWVSCSVTVYSSEHAPIAYSGRYKPDIRLDPGEVGIYIGFYQGLGVDRSIDFTNGWGDVTCKLTYHSVAISIYTERLP
jgi:hypothetical protein